MSKKIFFDTQCGCKKSELVADLVENMAAGFIPKMLDAENFFTQEQK
jgi:hypothetical protein